MTRSTNILYEFAGKAAAKGLQYLAETDLRVMLPSNYLHKQIQAMTRNGVLSQ